MVEHALFDDLLRLQYHQRGTVRPSAFAVLRSITSSNFVGCSTGRSGVPEAGVGIGHFSRESMASRLIPAATARAR